MPKFNLSLIIISFVLFFNACKKEAKPIPHTSVVKRVNISIQRKGFLAIHNDSVGASKLSFYDYDSKKFIPDIFSLANGRALGKNVTDMKVYGSKIYIIVSGSNILEIIDARTAKSIREFSFKSLKNITFKGNKAYFTKAGTGGTLNGQPGTVTEMDTATFSMRTVDAEFGASDLVVANNKLFVIHSKYWDEASHSGISVNKMKLYTLNPLMPTTEYLYTLNDLHKIILDKYGYLYLTSYQGLTIVNSLNNLPKREFRNQITSSNLNAHSMVIWDKYALMYDNNNTKIVVFNTENNKVIRNNFISDGTTIRPDKITIDEIRGEVLVRDKFSGAVIVFTVDGKKKYTLGTNYFGDGATAFINK